jgi:hypothetical protein
VDRGDRALDPHQAVCDRWGGGALPRQRGLMLQWFLYLDLENTRSGYSPGSLRVEKSDRSCWGPNGDVRWVWQAGASRM